MAVVKGSGVDEWPCMKLVWVFKYILVHVYIGVPIKLFFVRKPGEGGSPSKFFGNTDLKKLRKLRNKMLVLLPIRLSFRVLETLK